MNTATMNNVHSMNNEAAPAAEKKMTAWGATWRVAGVVLLVAAVVAAVIFAGHYAIGYLGTLGLSELALQLSTYGVMAVAAIFNGFVMYFGASKIVNVIRTRQAAKAAA